ncbi:MAG: type II toxin-antitoxin system RelE/ParE family toxin [Acidobacteria bacterium]|nr:type II toxin-antitoxin system RelE/ParE family toxin [Acidobacteriota bacterium]
MIDGSLWRVVVTGRAEGELKRLTPKDQGRIRSAIDTLATGPGGDLRKLRGREAEWRLRVGDWRVRFRIDFTARVVVVLRVLPRGSAYRN